MGLELLQPVLHLGQGVVDQLGRLLGGHG
jgi:hypothetical protein